MKRWLKFILLAAVCLAIGAAATALAEGKGRFVLDQLSQFRAPPPPPRGDRDAPPPPDVKDRAGDHLAQAYDTLTVVGLAESSEGRQTDKDSSRLLDSGREFYREAHKAYKDGDYERAAETALAANDSARGILYTLKANAGKQADLPLPPVVGSMGPPPPRGDHDAPPAPRGDRRPTARGDRDAPPPPSPGDRPPPPPRGDRDAPPPPRGDRDAPPPPPPGGPGASREPQAAATDAIQHAEDRLNDAPADVKGPGRPFLDAAHKSLDLAKQAQKDGDSFKAINLARAAEAWSHVEEHLARAEGAAGDRPPPRGEPRERPREELKRPPPTPPSND